MSSLAALVLGRGSHRLEALFDHSASAAPGSGGVLTIPSLLLRFQELGLIRKPASFMTSICDERGQELIYAGMPITEVFKEEMGIGGVLGLLWFQKR